MNAGAPDPGAPGPGAAGAIALIVLAQLVLASKGIFAKVLYAEGVGVVTLIALRGAIALPLFWAFALWRLGGRALIEVSPRAVAGSAAAGFVCYYIGSYLDFTALELIDASLERVLLYSFPAIVVLIEAARRKTLPAARQWVALVLAYAGIVLVMGGFDVGLLAANLVGAALVLICAVTFAAYFLAGQAISPRIGSIRFTVYAHTAAAAGLGAHFAVTAVPGALTLSVTAWAIVLFMATVGTVIPFFMLSEGIRRIGASRAALISTVGPPATIVMAYAFLGEVMTPVQLAGASSVVIGVIALEARLPRLAPRGRAA